MCKYCYLARRKAGTSRHGDILLFVCSRVRLFVRLIVCRLQCAAAGGLLLVTGTYRVGQSDCTLLLYNLYCQNTVKDK